MVERGFVRAQGVPNISMLAREAGVAVETARRALLGIGRPNSETVVRLVSQLGPEVQQWAGLKVDLGPYEPPREAALLTERERRALDHLIRVMAGRKTASE
jgi:hypothetical protein